MIVVYVLLFLFCVGFLELFMLLGLRKEAAALLERSREAVRVMAAKDMSDDSKEAFMRTASLTMLRTTATFTLKFLAVLAALYAAFLGIVAVVPDLEQPLLASFVSPPVILLLTISTVLYAWLRNAVLKQL